MEFAALKQQQVINIYLYDNQELAQQFYNLGAMGDADSFVPLSIGYGIGDYFDGESWTKNPEVIPVPMPTEFERFRADLDFLAMMTGVEL